MPPVLAEVGAAVASDAAVGRKGESQAQAGIAKKYVEEDIQSDGVYPAKSLVTGK